MKTLNHNLTGEWMKTLNHKINVRLVSQSHVVVSGGARVLDQGGGSKKSL